MVWAKGQKLQGGKYVIQGVLGQGGFGISYKALHVSLNHYVVIKTPNEYLQDEPDDHKYLDRFMEEGRILARLSRDPHPHIVGVHDSFQEGSIYCLVRDFVEGESLFELVRRRGTIPEAEAVRYIRQIGEALTVVHQAGLTHRDATPANIILRPNGNAVLIDFGIAKELMPSTDTSAEAVGNRGFAPFEQLYQGSQEPNVDVYCLAATLYYVVTGQRPTNSLDRKLNNEPLIPPQQIVRGISDYVNQAILKGMALEPNNRPQSMPVWLELLKSTKVVTLPWAKGQKLQAGKYVIQEVLGQGGYGTTYKALHISLNRYVVIKTPNEYLQHKPDYNKYVARFIEEGQILARLSKDPHSHIVEVHDSFQEGAIYCLVMEFVDGENLFELVRRRGAIPEAEAVRYIHQIGQALAVVHQAGLTHRDAHPGNILLRQNGKAVLIDFGIAKELIPSTHTSTGTPGNPGFAPYEQACRGSREPNVDVYCLAATLYYALTGQCPTNALYRKLDNEPLIPPKQIVRGISDYVNQAILKGMELEPEDRPQSMREWLDSLGLISEASPPAPTPPPVKRGLTLEQKIAIATLILAVLSLIVPFFGPLSDWMDRLKPQSPTSPTPSSTISP
jgi:serine/threonine protein kinase